MNEAMEDVSCKQAARLMSQRKDRLLTDDESESLKRHLYVCLNCARFDKQLDFLRQLATSYAEGAYMENAGGHTADNNRGLFGDENFPESSGKDCS